MVKVIPLVIPNINWSSLTLELKQYLGRKVTKNLDAEKVKKDDLGFLVTLAESIDYHLDKPNDFLENPGQVLNHLSYSFLVIVNGDVNFYAELLEHCTLKILPFCDSQMPFDALILTGTLTEWKHFIISGCSADSAARSVKLVCSESLNIFEKLGLGNIWIHYRKQMMKDNTLKLEKK